MLLYNLKIQNLYTLGGYFVPQGICLNISKFEHLIKIDSTLTISVQKWNQLMSLSEKFSDLFDKEINHKSKIKSLADDIKKITKGSIPDEFKTPPIIGRLRVLKTYLQKIDSYKLDQENLDEYKKDVNRLLESYNALVYQINLKAKENLEN